MTSQNVEAMRKSQNPEIRRLLGQRGRLWRGARPDAGLGGADRQGGRQLRRNFRAQSRTRIGPENSARPQCPVARRRAALRPAGAMRRTLGVRRIAIQAGLLLALGALFAFAFPTRAKISRARGIPTSFAFLHDVAGFSLNQSLISFSPLSSYGRALLVGLLNTLAGFGPGGDFRHHHRFRRRFRAAVAQSGAGAAGGGSMSRPCATCRCCCKCCSAMSLCSRRCRGRRILIILPALSSTIAGCSRPRSPSRIFGRRSTGRFSIRRSTASMSTAAGACRPRFAR